MVTGYSVRRFHQPLQLEGDGKHRSGFSFIDLLP